MTLLNELTGAAKIAARTLKEERLRQKLSLNEVAARSGLNHTMIGREGRRERLPTIDTLLRIANALEIKLAQFLEKAQRGSAK